MASGHCVYVSKDLRIGGYFSKPKGVHEQKCLGNIGLDLPSACVGTFDLVTLKFQTNKDQPLATLPHPVYPLASPANSSTVFSNPIRNLHTGLRDFACSRKISGTHIVYVSMRAYESALTSIMLSNLNPR